MKRAAVRNTILVLDAMGVMYQPADDVADLLIPFVRARGCGKSDGEITRLYRAASRGSIDSRELWTRLGIAEDAVSVDQQIAAAYTITDGLSELLGWCAGAGMAVACISNDLAEWAVARAKRPPATTSSCGCGDPGDFGNGQRQRGRLVNNVAADLRRQEHDHMAPVRLTINLVHRGADSVPGAPGNLDYLTVQWFGSFHDYSPRTAA